jgi:hypothetical protein
MPVPTQEVQPPASTSTRLRGGQQLTPASGGSGEWTPRQQRGTAAMPPILQESSSSDDRDASRHKDTDSLQALREKNRCMQDF